MVKLLLTYFFKIEKKANGIKITANVFVNYCSVIIALTGFLFCFNNKIIPAIVLMLIVFCLTNLKMIIYYKIYKKYSDPRYILQERGSKYSFKDPQVLEITYKKIS